MAWRIEITKAAEKQLTKLAPKDSDRIVLFLRERIAPADDPRRLGAPLSGGWAGSWRYRVGDYRVICDIQDGELIVLVIEIGHRREVYR